MSHLRQSTAEQAEYCETSSMRMRSRSGPSLGSVDTCGLSKSYGGGLNSRSGARQTDRYICKSNYGGTRYRTRSGYDPDYMPRYNTFSGYRNRDRQAYSSAGNYPSYRGKIINSVHYCGVMRIIRRLKQD